MHLRKNYASITQIVFAKYADIMQIGLRSNYAIVSILRNYVTQKYANKLRKSLRRLRNHYRDAVQLRKYDYAIPQKVMTQTR